MAQSEEKLKSLLMKVKEKSEKAGLTFKVQQKLRSWHPVPSSGQTDTGNNGNSDRLFYCAPKPLCVVTAAKKLKDACSLEEKL